MSWLFGCELRNENANPTELFLIEVEVCLIMANLVAQYNSFSEQLLLPW